MRGIAKLVTVLGGVAMAACSSGAAPDAPGPTPSTPTPTISIALSKTNATIQQGNTDIVIATVTRGGGFTGSVNIAATNVPAGVTLAAATPATTGGVTVDTVVVAVAATAIPGTYSSTVTASGSGVADVSASVTLTITATPAVAISVAPANLSIDQGASANTTLTIARTNFTDNVSLALENQPAGVSAIFTTSPTTGTSVDVKIVVASTTIPGAYQLVLRATGTGIVSVTTPLALTVTIPPSFTLGPVTPTPVTIVQGATGSVVVPITRTSFAGAVSLTLEAESGITGVFTPTPTTGNSANLVVTVAGSVAPGQRTVTVRGTATGAPTTTTTFIINVTPAVVGGFTLTLAPTPSVSIVRGASADVTVTITRTGGFTGAVTLAATTSPSGPTLTVPSTAIAGNSATITVATSSLLAIGAYQLTATGTATGATTQQAAITVNVTLPTGNTTIDFSHCASVPTWFAIQDGVGSTWTNFTSNNGIYTLDVTQPKVGIAAVFSNTGGNASQVLVNYWTKAEAQSLTTAQLCPLGGKSVTVPVTNAFSGGLLIMSLGGSYNSGGASVGSTTIANVPSGVFDIVGSVDRTPLTLARGAIRRDVNTAALTDGASVAPIDMQGAESFAFNTATMSLSGTAFAESVSHTMFLYSGASCARSYLYTSHQGLLAGALPPSMQRGNDWYGLQVDATDFTAQTSRTVTEYFQTFGARSLAAPSLMPSPSVSSVAGPYKRLRFQATVPADLGGAITATYQEVTTVRKVMTIAASSAYLASLAIDVTMPDFSGVASWQNAFAPPASATGSWQVTATAGTGTPCTGGRVVSSNKSGSY